MEGVPSTPVAPPIPPPATPTAAGGLGRVAAARGPAPLRGVEAKPEDQYKHFFQEAQERAKQGDEKGALDALSKTRHYRDGATVSEDTHAQNERTVYAALYDSTLQSAKDEIEGHQGGGWHKVKRAVDPFIEANFDRKTLFAKLDEYASKAGLTSVQVDAAKKEIDGALYDYYQKQAMIYSARAARGEDVDARVEKFVSKMREVGPGAGHSGDKVEQDAKNLYRNLFERKLTNMKIYVSENGGTKEEITSDPLFGPKMFELARKAGISEVMATHYRDGIFLENPTDIECGGILQKLVRQETKFRQKSGRETTMADRLTILNNLPETGPYKTYNEWMEAGYRPLPPEWEGMRLGGFEDLGPPKTE